MKRTMDKMAKRVMLENAAGDVRYEFWTRPVHRSNIDNTIAYYQPVITLRQCHGTGSTMSHEDVTVEHGNDVFKNLIAKGFHKVLKPSFA